MNKVFSVSLLIFFLLSVQTIEVVGAIAGAAVVKTNPEGVEEVNGEELIDPKTFQQVETIYTGDINDPDSTPSKEEVRPYMLPEKEEIMKELSLEIEPLPFNKMCYKRGLTLALAKVNSTHGIINFSCKGAPNTDLAGSPTSCGPSYGDTYCYRRLPVLCIRKLDLNRPSYSFTGSASSNGWSEGIVKITPPVPGCRFKYQYQVNNYCRKLFGCGFRIADYHDGRYMPGMNGTTYANFTWNTSSTYKGYYSFWTYVVNHNNTSNRYWVTHNDAWGVNPHCWK